MNKYLIQHKIRTVALLATEYCFQDIVFSRYDSTNPDCEYWIATKNQSGENFREAYSAFVQDLIGITDALSVVCHCSFSLLGTSYLVIKRNSSADSFFAHVAEIEPTGAVSVFTSQYVSDLKKLTGAEDKAALHFMRESNNAQTVVTRLAMTICAAEALAGTIQNKETCECGRERTYSSTNKAELQAVLGDEYGRLYKKSNGGALRHKLFHGKGITQQEAVEPLENVTQRILNHLRSKLSLDKVPRTNTSAPTFTRVREKDVFLRSVDAGSPDLKTVEENWNNSSIYTIVPEPDDY